MNLRLITTIAFAVLVVVLPWMIPGFLTFEFTYVGAYAIAILGLVILIGNSGQISLGHGAFVGVGGYTVAVLLQSLGLSYMFSIPIAALVCFLLGIALGAVALRLESIYLALATFALAASVSPLLKRFKHLTGGVQGISMPSPHTPQALQHVIPNETWFYYLTWGIAAVLFAIAFAGLQGRVGRSLRAIRDSEVAAIAFGINPVFYKTLAFGWSAAYAGVAGALLAVVTAYVSPDVYGVALSLTLLAGAVMGGLDLMWGAVIGSIAIEFLPLWAQRVNPALSSVAYGIAEIAIMMFMPIGIAGALLRIKAARS
jgi:branched-chain amino acid transport system permease protein